MSPSSIVNYCQAKIFNSSRSAVELARRDNNHVGFAVKMISIKNSNISSKLKETGLRETEINHLKVKKNKYDGFLKQLNKIENKKNSERNPHIIPYNDEPSLLSIKKIN